MKFINWIYRIISELVDDTLKRDKGDGKRRFSATRLTMFTAWMMVSYSYISDVVLHGFRWERFALMAGVATGMKVTDAIGKSLNKENPPQ